MKKAIVVGGTGFVGTQVCKKLLSQGWQVKAANLRPLVDEAAALLKSFGLAQLEKVPRDEIVRVLGH